MSDREQEKGRAFAARYGRWGTVSDILPESLARRVSVFEFIIMRQVKDKPWVIHRRLGAEYSEDQVKQIAADVAARYKTRVTVLGSDEAQVTRLFNVLSSGITWGYPGEG